MQMTALSIIDDIVAVVPDLPLEEPVIVFAVALAAFLVAPLLIQRIGVPGIVGIVLAGTALGPHGTGLLEHSDAIELLGTVGLVYLLFIVGLELDLRRFFNAPEDAAIFGLSSFFLPLGIGTAVVWLLLGLEILAAVLLAAVFASHTLLAYPVINRLDLTANSAVTAAFGGILFTDTLALVILALVLGAADGGITVALLAQVLLSLVILFGGVWVIVPRIARWFFRNLSQESYFEFLFVASILFLAGGIAEMLDLAAILGSFVAGLALNRHITSGGTLMNRIEFLGNAFFIPFFLLHVGMLVNPGVIFEGLETVWVAVVIVSVMIITKTIAAGTVSVIQGYSRNEFGVLVGLSVGQAAAALAITLLGFEAGLFGPEVLNAVVLMMLVSAVVSPWVTERFGTRLVQEDEVAGEAGEAYDPRIMLPIAWTGEDQRRLLELAFALKSDPAQHPVHLLRVLSPDASDETIADAESDLQSAAEHGGAAEVPVEVETRVNHNVASGIIRASVETRSDLILMGWDATRSLAGRVFGTIIDQVRQRANDPVIVSRLRQPINTSERVVLLLPHGIDHHDGFFESVFLIKRLVDNLGVEITGLVVGGPTNQYARLIDLVEPEMEVDLQSVDDWGDLDTFLNGCTENDLIVTIKPREGNLGWRPELRRLPIALNDYPPASFVIVTPRREEPEYQARFLRMR